MDAVPLAGTLLPRLRRWTADGWQRPATGPARVPRAEVAAATVQRLADLAADTEGRPRRPVPRLADTVLADQLAVLLDDVVRTGDPAAISAADAELAALKAALGY
jgi:hypothetical protein